MLVLKRKPGQFITVGNDVRVYVVGFDTTGVRIGIEAPKDIPVHRSEVAEAIVRNALATGEPLHRVEERLDHADACRPAEVDMITPPHKHDVLVENRHLRAEVARLKAELRNREHVG